MRIPRTTVVLLAFSALAGCVSLKRTAEPRYFALRPVARTPAVAASVAPASADVAFVVGVLPLEVPDLDVCARGDVTAPPAKATR
jgi:hypothetical protein